jgi:hypothetical protein
LESIWLVSRRVYSPTRLTSIGSPGASHSGLLSRPVSQGCMATTTPRPSGSRKSRNHRCQAISLPNRASSLGRHISLSPASVALFHSRLTTLAATGGWVMPDVIGCLPVPQTVGPGK